MKKEKQELRQIIELLEHVKDSMSISEINERFGNSFEKKTLLRRLNKLIDEKTVEKTGEKRGVVYHITALAEVNNELAKSFINELAEPSIPLTKQSSKLLSLINLPQANRKLVGYNRDFLESYRPNHSNYLTPPEKERLATLGKTARENEPAGTYAKDILQRLLIDLSWNSSRLEGNTYSLLDTERLISVGAVADSKPAKDAQMILNHKEAIEFIVTNQEDIGFNRYTILNIHALLANNLIPDPQAVGRLRRFGVGINQSVYLPLSVPAVVEELFDLLLQKVNAIIDPFEQAFFMMVHLPYLQPFDDVNKRVSRLAANISLNNKNLVPISFIDVPDVLYIKGLLAVYELNSIELLKEVFLWAYERSSARYSALRQTSGEPDPFRIKYRESIRSLISQIVSGALTYQEAGDVLNKQVATIDKREQAMFKEVIETELLSLHYGNIARYNVRPSAFTQWKDGWYK